MRELAILIRYNIILSTYEVPMNGWQSKGEIEISLEETSKEMRDSRNAKAKNRTSQVNKVM